MLLLLPHVGALEDISAVYEMESETCDTQAGHPEAGYFLVGGRCGNSSWRSMPCIEIQAFTPAYTENVLSGKNKLMWLQLFLHFADVSNPLCLAGS